MKKLFMYFAFFCLNLALLYAQEIPCLTKVRPDTSSIPKFLRQEWGQIDSAKVIIVFVDFPDGRYINGNDTLQPLDTSQLRLVLHKDAAGEVGLSPEVNNFYVGYNNRTFQDLYLKPAKYSWHDRWQMYFSKDGGFNNTSHPDFLSNGELAYGSFAEYWEEVSNGKFNIQPTVTHPNAPTYELQTGILNNYINMGNGRYVVDYMTLPLNKYGIDSTVAYFPNGSVYSFWQSQYWNKDVSRINLLLSDCYSTAIRKFNDFDFNDFFTNNGSIIFVIAGGHLTFKGKGSDDLKYTLIRGRTDTLDCSNAYSCLGGIAVMAHEFAHITPYLRWGHTNSGRYCIMNCYDHHDRNCPQHPSPFLKIYEGWITPIPLEHTQNSVTIPPVETSHQVGILTVYGKPTACSDIRTGEYYILENRRFIGFDRKIIQTAPYDFRGGLLVWHYSPYNKVTPYSVDSVYWDIERSVQLRAPLLSDTSYANGDSVCLVTDWGNSKHFFAWKMQNLPTEQYNYDSSRTYSSFYLKTGLALNNISNDYNNYSGNITLDINYKICDPPNYSYVMYSDGTSNQTYNLTGNIYIHSSNKENKYIFREGSSIDVINSLTLEAIKCYGTENNHISINGAGYSNYRTKSGFSIQPLTNSILSDSVIIKYCDLYNSVKSNVISPGQYNSNISIEHFNVLDTSVRYAFIGNQDYPPHLSKYEYNNIPKILISSKWHFDMDNDFVIPENYLLENNEVCETNYNPTNIVFSPATQSKILCSGKIYIKSDLICNRDINVGSTGEIGFFNCPTRINSTNIRFSENAGINCFGKFTAISSFPDYFQKLLNFSCSDVGYWNGILCYNPSSVFVNGVSVNNASTGISVSHFTPSTVNIVNSQFVGNRFADIKLDYVNNDINIPGYIAHNTFYGTPTQIFNLGLNDVSPMNIDSNTFNDVYGDGISLSYCSNPKVVENKLYASTNMGATPLSGIHCYNSYGFFGCNLVTNFYNGILLDNSSPYFLNNDIFNNGCGMYLTNNSNPILSPSYSQNQSLYIAGYNKIYNNMNDEIFCNNQESQQLSLPYLLKGYNSIYDNLNSGYLINVNYELSPPLEAQNNYWGGTPNNGMFSPDGSVDYSEYLSSAPSYANCLPSISNEDNSSMSQDILLLGSANLSDYNKNYNSASNSYKQYISSNNNVKKDQLIIAKLFNTHRKSGLNFAELNNYLINLANQHLSDTALSKYASFLSIGSNVEQSLYQQAINEYQGIINSSQIPYEIYYANIEKLRTITLMLDTLLNPGGGDNSVNLSPEQLSNLIYSSIISKTQNNKKDLTFTSKKQFNKGDKTGKSENNKGNNKSDNYTITENNNHLDLKQKNFNKLKDLLIPKNIKLSNLSNPVLVDLFENVVAVNLFEQSLLYYTPPSRPLNRIESKYLVRNNLENGNLPKVYKLSQNYPNPFNPVTKINFDLPKDGNVKLVIYDILGREVKQLVNEFKQAGKYIVEFNGNNLASGIYFYRIEIGNFVQVKKMMLIK